MLNFPNSPTLNQAFTAPDGSQWKWDSVKWLNVAGSGAYVPASTGSGLNNVGRNTLQNALFNIQQRGAGPWTSTLYGPDRWVCAIQVTGGGSGSAQIGAMTAATAAAFNDEAAQYNIQFGITAGTGAGDFIILRQFMENVRRFAGKQMTLSFWAWCASGTPKVCVEFAQQFGTGGSPSANVNGIGMTPITISTTPTRYSVTFTMPSVAGKTFGTTAGTDLTEVNLWMSAGSTYSASRAGSIGFQSGTFLFWGIQLEIVQPGQTQPSPLEKVDPGEDLRRCQRFYQSYLGSDNITFWAYGATNWPIGYTTLLPVKMRASPTVGNLNFTSANNISGQVVGPSAAQVTLNANIVATGTGSFAVSFTLSADF
jgi:hypothetical protein